MVLFGGIKPRRLFGSVLVEGNYGSGKTFFTQDECHALAWGNPDYYIISNIPFTRADVKYNSKEDWVRVLDNIYDYFSISNSEDELKDLDKYKNILVIMDEVHLYFPARKSMDKVMAPIWDKMNVVLTQCRKRNVKFYFITQRVQKTDIEFRRLSEFIYFLNFNKFLGLPINRLSIIRAGGGISDLIGEDGTTWENEEELKKDVIYSGIAEHNTFFFRTQRKLLHKDWPLWREKYLTNYICGIAPYDKDFGYDSKFIPYSESKLGGKNYVCNRQKSIYNQSFDDFYKGLFKPASSIKPCFDIKNQDRLPILQYGQKFYDYANTKKLLEFRKKYYKMNTSCI